MEQHFHLQFTINEDDTLWSQCYSQTTGYTSATYINERMLDDGFPQHQSSSTT